MRLIDADALIEFCAERWIPLNIDAVNMQPTIQPEKAQLSQEGTTSDLISRQAAIDIERNATVDTNPSHFEAHQKFTQFMDDAEISSFGRWQWSNGFNTALTAVGIDLKKLPPARPEPTDEQAIAHLQSSGWMQRHDKEMYESGLREQLADDSDSYDSLLPSAQPEPQEGHWIRRDCGLDVECKCSKCGYRDFVEPRDEYWFKRNYCPNCGADMRGGQNG